MKKYFRVLILFFTTSCSSPELEKEISSKNTSNEVVLEEENQHIEEEHPSTIYSIIRVDEPLIIGEVYTDTLTFLSFDDNYDYAFGVFTTNQNDTLTLVYNDIIDENSEGRKMVVEWKLDSLYEAGEGDELYFQERLVSFKTLRGLENSFQDYFGSFSKDLLELNTPLEKHLNKEVGFYNATNPGIYCILNKPDTITKRVMFMNYYKTANEIPIGDFCEGYSGIKNGFYYNRILLENLPTFISPGDDGVQEYKIEIPEKFELNEFIEVHIINNEYHKAYLYFIQIENKWYFFAQDFCDCSA